MKYKVNCSFILLILLLLFGCSDNDESKIEENNTIVEESLSIGVGNSVTYSLGNFSSEGNLQITKQANHFEVSEIKTGNVGMVFQYKPIKGFVGEDYVEITQTYGNNIDGKTIFKISIKVISE